MWQGVHGISNGSKNIVSYLALWRNLQNIFYLRVWMFMMFHVQWFNGVRPARKTLYLSTRLSTLPPPKHSQPHYDCLGVDGKNLSTLGQKVGFRRFQTTQRVNLGPTLHKGLDLTSQGCKNSFHKSDSQSKLFDRCHLVFSCNLYWTGPLATMDRSTSMVSTSNVSTSHAFLLQLSYLRAWHCHRCRGTIGALPCFLSFCCCAFTN